jgi:ABC-type sugar transport system permease subunit
MERAVENKNRFHFLKTRRFQSRVFIALMLAWPIAHFLVFWVFINGRTLYLTFMKFDYEGNITGNPNSYYWVGLENYINVFKNFFFSETNGGDANLRRGLINSLTALPLNVAVILPLAFFSAFAFFKKVRLTPFFRVVFYIPSIVSIVILTMLYKYMFDMNFGPLYKLLRAVGMSETDMFAVDVGQSKTIWPLIYFYCIWAGMGGNVILLSSAMARVPGEVLESARLDGVGFWREMLQIVLPLVWSTISTLIVMGTMAVFGFMMQPYLLAGIGGGTKGQTQTISLYIFNIVQQGSNEASAISTATIGMLFCLLGTPVVFLVKHFTEKISAGIEY